MLKRLSAVILIVLFFSVVGCETFKGAGQGFAKDTSKGVPALWKAVKDADTWVKENLW